MNTHTIMGRIGHDLELRHTPSGKEVLNLSVATTERWRDNEGEKQERTTWFKAEAWGAKARVITEYFKKGDGILLTGRGKFNVFDTDDGQTVRQYILLVKDFEFPVGRAFNNTVEAE